MPAETTKAPKRRVAAAALSAGGSSGIAGHLDPRRIEAAMGAAVEEALAEGVVDPDEILERKLAAREAVKKEWREEEKARLAAVEKAARAPSDSE